MLWAIRTERNSVARQPEGERRPSVTEPRQSLHAYGVAASLLNDTLANSMGGSYRMDERTAKWPEGERNSSATGPRQSFHACGGTPTTLQFDLVA